MAELTNRQRSMLRKLAGKRKTLDRAQKMSRKFPGNLIWEKTIEDLTTTVAVLTESLCLCPKWNHKDDFDGWEDFELACVLSDCPLHSGSHDLPVGV